MASWLDDYLRALDNRDQREKSNAAIIDAYAKLADYTISLQHTVGTKDVQFDADKTPATVSRLPARLLGSPRSPPAPKPDTEIITSLRLDFMAANRDKTLLKTELSNLGTKLDQMQVAAKEQSSDTTNLKTQLANLEHEKALLSRKLRDRDSELKEKARLVENVQDELLGLEMQINVAEEKAARLQTENKELVDRWMSRMGQEAEKMNEGSGWK